MCVDTVLCCRVRLRFYSILPLLLPTADLFPTSCQDKEVSGANGTTFEVVFILWSIGCVVALVWAGMRWRYHPLKVRDPIVVGTNVFFGWMALAGFHQYVIARARRKLGVTASSFVDGFAV
jgi:hypothetical protein